MDYCHIFLYFGALLMLVQCDIGAENKETESVPPIKKKGRLRKAKMWLKIMTETYCSDDHTAVGAEELLAIDTRSGQEWWRPDTFYAPFGRKIYHPLCSAFPNSSHPTTIPINSHDFFLGRNVDIPLQVGDTLKRTTPFKHRPKPSVDRLILDCHCKPVIENSKVDKLCKDGKISFSRGVGGDASFFVHDPDQFNVLAHICFPEELLHPSSSDSGSSSSSDFL